MNKKESPEIFNKPLDPLNLLVFKRRISALQNILDELIVNNQIDKEIIDAVAHFQPDKHQIDFPKDLKKELFYAKTKVELMNVILKGV